MSPKIWVERDIILCPLKYVSEGKPCSSTTDSSSLNIGTDRPLQTVASDQGLHCLYISSTILDISTGNKIDFIFSNFKTSMVRNYGLPILRVNTVGLTVSRLCLTYHPIYLMYLNKLV